MDGWNTFILGWPIFQGRTVSFRECMTFSNKKPEVVDLRCRLVTCEIDGSKQFCSGTGENTSFFLCAYSFVDGMLMVVLKQLIQQIQE